MDVNTVSIGKFPMTGMTGEIPVSRHDDVLAWKIKLSLSWMDLITSEVEAHEQDILWVMIGRDRLRKTSRLGKSSSNPITGSNQPPTPHILQEIILPKRIIKGVRNGQFHPVSTSTQPFVDISHWSPLGVSPCFVRLSLQILGEMVIDCWVTLSPKLGQVMDGSLRMLFVVVSIHRHLI